MSPTAAERLALAQAGEAYSEAAWQMATGAAALSYHRHLLDHYTPEIDPKHPERSLDLEAIREMLENLGNELSAAAFTAEEP